MEYWRTGVLEYWSNGVLEFWSTGVMEYWSAGVLEYWSMRGQVPGVTQDLSGSNRREGAGRGVL